MALNYYINQKGEIPNTALSMTDGGALERASRFHQTIPGYAPTPWSLWTIWPKGWAWLRCW